MATTPALITAALITAAQAGDREAIAALYLEHHRAVHRYLACRVGPDLAEDLEQEVWVRALRGLSSYRWTGRPLEAWLVTIARNLIADHARSSAARREVLLEDLAALEYQTGPLLEDQVLAELEAAPVRAAVGQLPAAHRQALVLTHWAGLTNAEISHRTGRSPAAVRTLKCRAGATLRLALTAA